MRIREEDVGAEVDEKVTTMKYPQSQVKFSLIDSVKELVNWVNLYRLDGPLTWM